ncbi:MAG: peptidase C1 [Saprospiraceae bacterium]|nr:peptidase C1 [Saprospiraceae bacterium]
MKKIFSLSILILMCSVLFAQNDKAFFKEVEPGFYQNFILKDISEVKEKTEKKALRKILIMDQTKQELANDPTLYKTYWHTPVVSQGNTGTCWNYSTTSMFESEIYRLKGKNVKISEMYTVYCEYIEKARRFIQERGNSNFAEGSEANAVKRMWEMYGAVPNTVYTGLIGGRKYHSHEAMFNEMNSFLQGLKTNNNWNEESALSTIKSIMNHYMGEPPSEFQFEGKTYTPESFLKNYMELNLDDYIDIMSLMEQPYWQNAEYKVPDNWWHSSDYYNVPLDVFMEVWNNAIENGYTMAIGGDVSEAGLNRNTNCAMIPDFDIPYAYINESARQFRFSNNTTTDDHGMHCVGYYKAKDGKMWYFVKDSSSGSRNVGEADKRFGYYFFRDDYAKLKMMNITVHKDAFKKYMDRFK